MNNYTDNIINSDGKENMKNETLSNPYVGAPRISKLYNDYNAMTEESSKRDLLLMYIVETMEDLSTNELSENDRNKIMEEVILKIENFICTSPLSEIYDYKKEENLENRLLHVLREASEALDKYPEYKQAKKDTDELIKMVPTSPIWSRNNPHSSEAEQAVLGALMVDGECWNKIKETISAEDFYQNNHRSIFEAIHSLIVATASVDVAAVSEVLKSLGELNNVGGEEYLNELAKNAPASDSVAGYALIVRERAVLRQLLREAHKIAVRSINPEIIESLKSIDKDQND